MSENVEPLVQGNVLGERKTVRVFPAYIEIAKTWGTTRTIAMRQVQGVDLNWWQTKVTIHTRDDEIELHMVEAKEVQQAILQNLS